MGRGVLVPISLLLYRSRRLLRGTPPGRLVVELAGRSFGALEAPEFNGRFPLLS